MTIQKLRTFLESLQDTDGKFISDDPIKSTAEYLLVHRFCPEIGVGDPEKARTYLRSSLPVFASVEVKKGFKLMEKILQIAVGIPEDTVFLSGKFVELSLSCVPVSVKSSLLLVLFMQEIENNLKSVLEEVIKYQRMLFKEISLDALYETAHNVMTFYSAQTPYNVENIIFQACTWLSHNILLYKTCVDLLAETVGVTTLCKYPREHTTMRSLILNCQNEDGGFPVFTGGPSAFHPSLVSLWALTASEQ